MVPRRIDLAQFWAPIQTGNFTKSAQKAGQLLLLKARNYIYMHAFNFQVPITLNKKFD